MKSQVTAVKNLDAAIRHHPTGKQQPWKTWGRIASHQLRAIGGRSYRHGWVDDSVLVVTRGALGLTGNVYFGLHEYWDMCFLLDFLRPEDLFVDGGANAGSYTVLAGKACGSTVLAIEPGHEALSQLFRNLRANHLENSVKVVALALADTAGTVNFGIGTSTINAVAKSDTGLQIGAITLDELCAGRKPVLIKLDLEGGELSALQGAAQVLSNPSLQALLVEDPSAEVCSILTENGFAQFQYNPDSRTLVLGERRGNNAIWVRSASLDSVLSRLKSARGLRA